MEGYVAVGFRLKIFSFIRCVSVILNGGDDDLNGQLVKEPFFLALRAVFETFSNQRFQEARRRAYESGTSAEKCWLHHVFL